MKRRKREIKRETTIKRERGCARVCVCERERERGGGGRANRRETGKLKSVFSAQQFNTPT